MSHHSAGVEIAGLLTTYNRAHLLPRILDGLARQDLPRERYEIVIVNDGSCDETRDLLESYAGQIANLRVIHQSHTGLASARNLAIVAARAPIVVFLDDDDIAGRGLLSAHLAAHARHPALNMAILGHTHLDEKIASLPLMHHVTKVEGQLFSYSWMK